MVHRTLAAKGEETSAHEMYYAIPLFPGDSAQWHMAPNIHYSKQCMAHGNCFQRKRCLDGLMAVSMGALNVWHVATQHLDEVDHPEVGDVFFLVSFHITAHLAVDDECTMVQKRAKSIIPN
mmetsp:Transcript_136819/g.272864  ORF Transcript_136819/g.272864 Transcript_136819/m.272864 type:complete len:121 (+) Transcript_136819:394-756(+)